MPTLPKELKQKLEQTYGFTSEDALFLTDSKELLNYFNQSLKASNHPVNILNWLKGPIRSLLKEKNVSILALELSPEQLGELADLTANELSFSVAVQKLLPELIGNPNSSPKSMAKELGLLQVQDGNSLEPLILDILETFPDKVTAYKKGKKGLFGFFMGQLMKKTESKIDPRIANELLAKHLN